MQRSSSNNPAFTFPEIKTTRTMEQRFQKILDEMKEYKEAATEEEKDMESIDILHAIETFLRGQFQGREHRIFDLVGKVYRKNSARGYYDKDCF